MCRAQQPHRGPLPDSICRVLAAGVFAGVGVKADVTRLRTAFSGVPDVRCVDFRDHALLTDQLAGNTHTLSDFVKWSTKKLLKKPPHLRRGPWADPLTRAMIEYAALDVMAGVSIWRSALDRGLIYGALPLSQARRKSNIVEYDSSTCTPPPKKRGRPSKPTDHLQRLSSLYPLGTKLRKKFSGIWFTGVIKRWYDVDDGGECTCRVDYDDGDTEDMSEDELLKHTTFKL